MAKTLLTVWLFCVVWASGAAGQNQDEGSWTWSAQVSASMAVNEAEWTVRHPYYGGGSETWETLRGTFSQGIHAQGDIELRNKYLGVRGTLGVLPQEFTQEAPARKEDFTLLLAGLSMVLYPLVESTGKLEPYILAGAGGQKAVGDMENTGYFLSGVAGILTTLSPRVSLDGGIQVFRLKYTQVDLGNNIQKDLQAHPVSLFLGVRVFGRDR